MIALSKTRRVIILLYILYDRVYDLQRSKHAAGTSFIYYYYTLYRHRLRNFQRALIRSLGIHIIHMASARACVRVYGNRSTWEKVISPMNFSRPILLCAFRIKTHTRQSDFLAALVCLYKRYTHMHAYTSGGGES